MAIRYTSSFDQTISFSDTCEQFSLQANAVQSFTLAGTYKEKYSLLFGMSSNANVFVGYNQSPATPPVGTKTAIQGVEFMTPDSKRYAQGGDVIYLVTPDATAYVGVSIRSIPN